MVKPWLQTEFQVETEVCLIMMIHTVLKENFSAVSFSILTHHSPVTRIASLSVSTMGGWDAASPQTASVF